MKPRADARKVAQKSQPLTGRMEKGLAKTSEYLSTFYKIKRQPRMRKNYQSETARKYVNEAKISKNKEEILIADETFPGARSSIQVQPVELRRQARAITRKTPRWQPRGDDTQSFRPLVQEERGVLRVRLLALSTRVNTLFRLRQQKCG